MALYDYIKIEWSHPCDIGNIYYSGGFGNKMFFKEDMSAPEYSIEQEGKEVEGSFNATSQIRKKKHTIELICVESVADILSLIPLHETVRVQDKDGNAFTTTGADVEISVAPAEYPELLNGVRYKIMRVKLTFCSEKIIMTSCCQNSSIISCSVVLPTIDTVEHPTGTSINVKGTAPAGHCVRLKYREYIEQIVPAVTMGQVEHICSVPQQGYQQYACGEGGKIYRTNDGWANFAEQTSGVAFKLKSIYFHDNMNGWACGLGNQILYTTDGGTSWNSSPSSTGKDMYDIHTSDGNTIYCCGADNTIEKSVNSGLTWATSLAAPAATIHQALWVKTDQKVVVVGTNDIIKETSDGGATWNTRVTGEGEDWYDIFWGTGDTTYVVGTNATIISNNNQWTTNFFTDLSDASITGHLHTCYGSGSVFFVAGETGGSVHKIETLPLAYTEYLRSDIKDIYCLWTLLASGIWYIFASGNDNLIASTVTPYNNGNEATATDYEVDGITELLTATTTYEIKVCTFIVGDSTNECACCSSQLTDTS